MIIKPAQFIVLISVLFVVACSKSEPEAVSDAVSPPAAQKSGGSDSTEEISAKAGDTIFIPGGQHLPKNISDSAWELVLIELK